MKSNVEYYGKYVGTFKGKLWTAESDRTESGTITQQGLEFGAFAVFTNGETACELKDTYGSNTHIDTYQLNRDGTISYTSLVLWPDGRSMYTPYTWTRIS